MKKELRNKIIFTIITLIVVQFLYNIPSFGINKDAVSAFLNTETGSTLSFFAMFSGNAFYQMSMFVLGITPYISASIILQLLRVGFTSLDEMAKNGKNGEKRFKRMNYELAIILAIPQTIAIVAGFANYGLLTENTLKCKILVGGLIILGSGILMLIGYILDKKGIGQGISLILFLNIISRVPSDAMSIYERFLENGTAMDYFKVISIAVVIIFISLVLVTYLQDGEKRLKTQYASINKISKGEEGTTFIPIKVNLANVMPIIFASSIFQCYILLITLLKVDDSSVFMTIAKAINSGNWFNNTNWWYTIGYLVYVAFIFLFALFYNDVTFDTEKITKNLNDNGGVIIGVRPGQETMDHLNMHLRKTTIIGSLGLIIVATIPIILSGTLKMATLSLGGTSIIIIANVICDTYRAIKCEKLEESKSTFLF